MNNIGMYDDTYHKPVDIESEVRRIGVAYKDVVTVSVIGESAEGRKLYSVRVHKNADDGDKPILFINCGSHSREWLSISSCMYTLRRVVFDMNYDTQHSEILDTFDKFTHVEEVKIEELQLTLSWC